ncbi:MAG TPA: FHA domain-containing protein [Chloroflexota bacterium]|nr:FHA domain-containing protein [Chloroflexota bacterium]
MINCPQCGTQNLPGMAYCEHCGAPLEAPETQAENAGPDQSAADAMAQAQALIDQLPADNPPNQTPAPADTPADPPVAADPPTPTVPVDPDPPAAPATPAAAPGLTLIFATGGQHEVTSDITNVGRSDVAQNWHPELDLIPFGGAAPDLGVSRHQARIQRSGDTFSMTDVGSTNGTFVNGRVLEYNQPIELHDGDSIAFGAFNAKVSIH